MTEPQNFVIAKKLLDTVPDADIRNAGTVKEFFERALRDFILNPSVMNAESVYSYFLELYRLEQTGGKPLADMMDVMHTYETNASVFTEKHRDHYVHSVSVFVLGLVIYQSCPSVSSAFSSRYGKGSFTSETGSFLFTWGNAALFHDIGYPIEIASNQAKRFVRTLSGIANPDAKPDVGIKIEPESDMLVLKTASWSPAERNALDLLVDGIDRFLPNNPDRIRDLTEGYLAKMFREHYVDHGFYGALILLRTYAESMQRASLPSDRFDLEIVTAASAIFMHNLYPYNLANDPDFGPLKVEQHPAGFLLMLCDILQEWNRKGYGKKNYGMTYPKNSGIKVTEDSLRVNYVSEGARLPTDFGKKKEEELKACLGLESVFANGVRITSSCGDSADVLIRELENEVSVRPMLGRILEVAQAIHEDYNRQRLIEKPDEPLEYPDWETLPQDLKYSNVDQAMSFPKKIEAIGCTFRLGGPSIKEFTADEVEIMAIMEHDRWVNERVTNGWVYGKEKNVDLRISPYVAPWEEIPEYIREYDRQAVRNMLRILNGMGVSVVRIDDN